MSRNVVLCIHATYYTIVLSFHYDFVQGLCYAAGMDDQIIGPVMAKALQDDVTRTHALSGWLVMRDPPDYPGRFSARLVTYRQTAYVMLADTLSELQAMLPVGLERSDPQPGEPPEVVEIWFASG